MRRLTILKRRANYRPSITLTQLFNEWFPTHSQNLSSSSISSYKNAFKHISQISNIPITDIHFQDLQTIIDSMHKKGLSYSSCKKVRTLLNQLFTYAIINDYHVTNYAMHLNLGVNTPIIKRHIFTRQQINKLWIINDKYAHMILILLYTGLRIGELLNLRKQNINRKSHYFIVSKSKTDAGTNRLIPIHRRIMPLLVDFYQSTDDYLFNMSYTSFRHHFMSIMKLLKCTHTIHDTRHTFASLLDPVASPNSLRSLLGHKHGDITTRIYTHTTIRELRKTIELLK